MLFVNKLIGRVIIYRYYINSKIVFYYFITLFGTDYLKISTIRCSFFRSFNNEIVFSVDTLLLCLLHY